MTGVAYSVFAGQPLTILGSTGPVLVFEKILFKFCKYVLQPDIFIITGAVLISAIMYSLSSSLFFTSGTTTFPICR